MSVIDPWLDLGFKALALGFDAQSVMALRMMKLAAGGAHGQAEASRMITEKMAAAIEAQTVAMAAIMTGRKHHSAAKKVLGVYHKQVRANRRRLSRR